MCVCVCVCVCVCTCMCVSVYGSKRRGKHKEYKLLRNFALKLIRGAKAGYYKEYVETNKHKLAKLFDELSGNVKETV